MKKIPYALQWIDEDDIAAVVAVLRSDFITTGPKVAEFEDAIKSVTGADYAVAVSNCTAALHAACFAAGIGPGDEVITTPLTFAASANCVLYLGGRPVFCDIDPDTWNIDPDKIESLITARTKAILPVHYAGQPCRMDRIRAIAEKHGLRVIEDAAHAIGARAYGSPVGCGGNHNGATDAGNGNSSAGGAANAANTGSAAASAAAGGSDMTCFSFHPAKHITTGEGGAITTNDPALYQKLAQFRSHGVTRDASLFQNPEASQDGWYYEQQFLGFNYRLTDIQAALGISQLKKLTAFLRRRDEIVAAYRSAFEPLARAGKLRMQTVAPDVAPAWHLFTIAVDAARRSALYNALHQNGVAANLHYIPVYLHPYYQALGGYPKGLCPVAESLYASLITLPLYPKMTDEDVAYVVETVYNRV